MSPLIGPIVIISGKDGWNKMARKDFQAERFYGIVKTIGIDPNGIHYANEAQSDTVHLHYPNFMEVVGYDKKVLRTEKGTLSAIEDLIEAVGKQIQAELEMVRRYRKMVGK